MILIEPFHHYEVLHSLLRMVLATGGSATVITNDFCKEHIQLDNPSTITWLVAPSTEEVMLQKPIQLQKASTIVFTTIDPYSIFWTWRLPRKKVMAYIHNAHSFFDVLEYSLPSFLYRLRNWSYAVRGDYQRQKEILAQLTSVLVPDERIADHLRSRIILKNWKKIKTLPFAFPEFTPKIHLNDPIQITVPGTISNQLRDYEILITCLPKVDQIIKIPVQINLLGRLKETKIRRSFKKLTLKNIQIKLSEDYISHELFEEQMRVTDFLLLPIREKMIYKAHYEYRGKSSVSGNINDLVRYALPAILPDFYPLDNSLEEWVIRYSDEKKLTDILIMWISNQAFDDIKRKKSIYFDEYQEKVLASFKELLN